VGQATRYLPWLVGAACICANFVARYLSDRYVKGGRVLSSGSPVPAWVSKLALAGFTGLIACSIWSITVAWWAPIPPLVAYFLFAPLVPSENSKAWQRGIDRFTKAEGSEFQRLCVATTMSALEDRELRETVHLMSSADQLVFMMAYACAVMWCLKRGMEGLLKAEDIESAIVAMRQYFAKHAWYQPKAFQEIWDKMQVVMPISMKTDHGPYPVADMITAANMAGYPISVSKITDIRFGMYVALRLGGLVPLGRSLAGGLTNSSAECQHQSLGQT
jgi:hypothetical protein